MNTGAILLNLGMAFVSPFLGRIVDRLPARLIMMISGIVFGGSLAILGLSESPLISAVVIALPLGAAVVGCGTLTSPALVSRWFVVHRSRALAISTIGISLGPVLVTPAIGAMIDAMGWRSALIWCGGASSLLIVAMATFVRSFPLQGDVEPGSTARETAWKEPSSDGEALTSRQLLRYPQFWSIALGCALVFGVLSTDIISLVPLAQDGGLSTIEAASLMTAYGVSAVLGALLYAWIGDRFNQISVFSGLAVIIGIANAGLLIGHGYAAVLICAAFIGLTAGVTSPCFMALIANYFGVASFGVAIGSASLISTLASAVFVRFGGEVFDRSGSYEIMLISFLIVGLLSAATLSMTRHLPSRQSENR
jgi:MFS family permease